MPSIKNSDKKSPAAERSGRQNLRWTVGLIMLFFGIYLLFSILCYYIDWKTDCSSLADYARFKGDKERLALIEFDNPCGRNGARLADLLVGSSFGLFGIIIPILLIILSLRVTRLKMLHLNRLMSIGILVLIFGTLTLGFIFKDNWSIFGSGLGGRWGIAGAEAIVSSIGAFGAVLVILAGWILTGVYINRSFIRTVNHAGEAIADGMMKVGKAVIDPMVKSGEKQPASAEDETEEKAEPKPEAEKKSEPVVDMPVTAEEKQTVVSEVDDDTFIEESAEEPAEDPAATEELEEDDIIIYNPTKEPAQAEDPAATDVKAVENVTELDDGLRIVVLDHKDKELSKEEIDASEYDPMKDLPKYQRPPISLLEDHSMDVEVSDEEIFENKERIKSTLQNFGIAISKIKATVGPTVTLYEIIPAPGIKIAKIKSLENDIAMNLKALGIRIIAPIPGKGTVGIEVPNKDRDVVSMLSAIKSARFQQSQYELPVVLGRTIQNENFVIDLAKMPHLLVAGATGQGKSVGLNAIITSLLYKKHPAELKFVMVDPKRVELSLYAPLEHHFLAKMESEDEAILTDTQKVIYTLNSLVIEMENRYELLRKASVKKITEYNDKFRSRRLNPQKGHRFMPYIVVVIDEFADLIMTAGREIETPISRLAQMGRAVGLHLIIATQRPEVKVITGLIKSNFPARIAFRVMSAVDSRTIIDQTGANQLIGRGDMLMSLNSELTRVQCAFVDTPEIENIISYIAQQNGYPSAYSLPDYVPESSEAPTASNSGEAMRFDPLFSEIARWFVQNGQASTSSIQRNFEVGFNRAGRIMNQLERAGIVGRQEGSKPRDLKVTDTYALERILQDLGLS